MYQSIIESIDDVIYAAHPKTFETLYVNKAVKKLYGYTPEELKNDPSLWKNSLHPDDKENLLKKLRQSLVNKENVITEYRIFNCNGGVRWVRDHNNWEMDAQGNAIQLNGFAVDITEQKKAEEKLLNSEKFFRDISFSMADLIWEIDNNARYVFASGKVKEILGYTPEQLIGKTPFEFMPKEEAERIAEIYKEIASNKKPIVDLENWNLHKDGTRVSLLTNGVPILNDNGGLIGYRGVNRDVTERKKNQMALRESLERYQVLYEETPVMLHSIDQQGRLVSVSKSWLEKLGYKREEVIGKPVADFLTEESRRYAVDVGLPFFIKKGFVEDIQYRFRKKNGETIETLLSAVAEKDAFGNMVRSLSVIIDVTEKKKAEREKEKLEAQLRQSHKMQAVGTLAGGIAHDFNNILNSIFGQIHLLKNVTSEKDDRYDKIENISIAAIQARDLVKQILVFSRQNEMIRQPILLQPIVEEALQLMGLQKNELINVRQKIDMECGAVKADPIQIQQVCTNLIANAYQAMNQDGGLLKVRLTEIEILKDKTAKPDLTPGKYAKITVKDTGQGMNQEVLDKIFDPYFTTRIFGEGTGLGLAIVDGIVKSHGGEIIVDSMPGHGTVFDVFLPLSKEQIKLMTAERKEEQVPHKAIGNILFIDDEKASVQVWGLALKVEGFNVTGYSDSLEALDVFRESPETFDIIITDQRMPNLTGVELTRKARQIRPDIPVILSTGWNDSINENQAKDMGIEIMSKPLEMKDLLKLIRYMIK